MRIKKCNILSLLMGIVIMIAGCQTPQPLPRFTAPNLDAGMYQSKIDHFIVILDASSSMNLTSDLTVARGQVNLDVAKAILTRMNQTLPQIKTDAAIRVYGYCEPSLNTLTKKVYGWESYSTSNFQKGIDGIVNAGGTSPAAQAFQVSMNDLADKKGRIALIYMSDGEHMAPSPLENAKMIADKYKGRICMYPIWLGKSPESQKLMADIAKASGCGSVTKGSDLLMADNMVDFVKKVFIKPLDDKDGDGVIDEMDKCPQTSKGVKVDAAGCPLDADKDGIADYLDKCPGTPKNVEVDNVGCPVDTDKDGVADYMDKCSNTPEGVKVQSNGCPYDTDKDGVFDYQDKCPDTPAGTNVNSAGCWTLKSLQFETGKFSIKSTDHKEIDHIMSVLEKNPTMRLVIQGHTDNVGRIQLNQKLSENRAKSVMDYLIKKGIDAKRLSFKGFGPFKPIADNNTEAGRAKNRRVEIKPSVE